MRCLMSLNQREAIAAAIPSRGSMLEWGCGGTTLWLLQNLAAAQHVVSVEHHAGYANEVRGACQGFANWRMIEASGGSIEPGRNATPAEECPAGLTDYVCAVSAEVLATFDVFLIDGVARGACLCNVLLNAKPGAIVFLHDVQRDWYQWAIDAGRRRLREFAIIAPTPGDYPSLMGRGVIAG